MGLMTRRKGVRLALLALALLAVAAAADLWQLRRVQSLNLLIGSGQVPAPAAGAAPELQFAHAQAQAASGAVDAAINRYGAIAGTSALGRAARYNGANLLLRQALELHANQRAGQALALVELAKEGYREVLRHDADDWAARYNLERAQRLLPDPEEGEDVGTEAPRAAERSATTMRGYSPGLP